MKSVGFALLFVVQCSLLFGQGVKLEKKEGSAKLQKAKSFGVSNLLVIKKSSAAENPADTKSSKFYANRNTANKTITNAPVTFGLGLGLDYGGIGGRLTILPDPHLGLFVGGGYAIQGAGFNGGIMARMQPQKKYVPTISAMYGYNAVIAIKNLPPYPPYTQYSQLNKLYYGPSLAFGLICKSEKRLRNYWHFEVIVPFRSSEYKDNIALLQKDPNITLSAIPPFALIGVGYHF